MSRLHVREKIKLWGRTLLGSKGRRPEAPNTNNIKMGNKVLTRRRLCAIKIAYEEDPYVAAAGPLYEWKQTDHGQYCFDKAQELEFHITDDHTSYTHRIMITGYMNDLDYTFMILKYGDIKNA